MSRELNKLAATEVMGWTWFKDPDNFKPGNWIKDGKAVGDEHWFPDVNIAHAWQLVEAMGGCAMQVKSCGETILSFHNGTSSLKWEVDEPFVNGSAKTTPMAIVLGCLKAKGIDVSKWEK